MVARSPDLRESMVSTNAHIGTELLTWAACAGESTTHTPLLSVLAVHAASYAEHAHRCTQPEVFQRERGYMKVEPCVRIVWRTEAGAGMDSRCDTECGNRLRRPSSGRRTLALPALWPTGVDSPKADILSFTAPCLRRCWPRRAQRLTSGTCRVADYVCRRRFGVALRPHGLPTSMPHPCSPDTPTGGRAALCGTLQTPHARDRLRQRQRKLRRPRCRQVLNLWGQGRSRVAPPDVPPVQGRLGLAGPLGGSAAASRPARWHPFPLQPLDANRTLPQPRLPYQRLLWQPVDAGRKRRYSPCAWLGLHLGRWTVPGNASAQKRAISIRYKGKGVSQCSSPESKRMAQRYSLT